MNYSQRVSQTLVHLAQYISGLFILIMQLLYIYICTLNEIFRKFTKKTIAPETNIYLERGRKKKTLEVNGLASLSASIPLESELSHFHRELIYINIKYIYIYMNTY